MCPEIYWKTEKRAENKNDFLIFTLWSDDKRTEERQQKKYTENSQSGSAVRITFTKGKSKKKKNEIELLFSWMAQELCANWMKVNFYCVLIRFYYSSHVFILFFTHRRATRKRKNREEKKIVEYEKIAQSLESVYKEKRK